MTSNWLCDNAPSARWPVYTRGNVGEVFPDAVTPLGWTLAGPRAEAAWRRGYIDLGAFRPSDFDSEFCFVGIFNGYCYLNASLLRVFGVRAPGASPEAIDTQLLGESSAPPYDERPGDRSRWLSARMLRSVLAYLNTTQTPSPAIEARAHAERWLATVASLGASDEELLADVTAFGETFEEMFRLHLLATAGSQILGGYLGYLCTKAGEPGLQLDLTTDLGEVESALPGEDLWRLGRLVRSSPQLTAAFDAGLDGLTRRVGSLDDDAGFAAAFDGFLADHGHRGPNEWELASPTWRSDPPIALAAVDRMRLAGDDRSPSVQRDRAARLREAAEEEILGNLGWNDRRNYRKLARSTALYAQARETTKNQIIRVVNSAREALRELARRAASRGGDPDFTRVCMLRGDELGAYLDAPAPMMEVIDERHRIFRRIEKIDPPFVVVGHPPDLEELEQRSDQELVIAPPGTELQGAGGSPGVVEGRARVVLDPADPAGLQPGEILVAPITDPSWTPLFMPAAGVVVDVGAVQSHAVVVSRELCIPCVVSVKRATRIIPDGAMLRIDGSAGTVRVLTHGDPPAPAMSPTAVESDGSGIGVSSGDWVVPLRAGLGLDPDETAARLGGKAAGLLTLMDLGVAVPPAFAITTDAWRTVRSSGWPAGLDDQIDAGLDWLASAGDLGRFGDGTDPLLVSVRSGAPVSMPGMLDTVLNVGMTPAIRDRLAALAAQPTFASASFLRFCRMYAEVVCGVDRGAIDEIVGTAATTAELDAAAARLAEIAPAGGIPLDPRRQLRDAIAAVFGSWDSPRAQTFRRTEGISDDLGTAVVVQAMVFGNLDSRSGTGVVFSRDPATGRNELYGDYLPVAQGEDVVSGTRSVEGLDRLETDLPDVARELREVCRSVEVQTGDMCDIEFTVAAGRLFVLQTRVGRRSPAAAVRMAVEMAQDPAMPVDRAEAVARIDERTATLLASEGTVVDGVLPAGQGLAASPGVGVGRLCVDSRDAAELARAGEAVVLARPETSPDDVGAMIGAAGLLTAVGGVVSHAAVVARSWSIPAVTSVQDLVVSDDGVTLGATTVRVGEIVTVDGSGGRVYIGDQRAESAGSSEHLATLRRWAADIGVELGERRPATPVESTPGDRPVDLLELVRAVQLKGVARPATLAPSMGWSADDVRSCAGANATLISDDGTSITVTAAGRAWLDEQLAIERRGVDVAAGRDVERHFAPLDRRFKEAVSQWQLGTQDAAARDALRGALRDVHRDVGPLVERAGELVPRLAQYRPRLEAALGAVSTGDMSMVASPLSDSYHTIWFELHEELIGLAGRRRADVESEDP